MDEGGCAFSLFFDEWGSKFLKAIVYFNNIDTRSKVTGQWNRY